MSTIIRFDLKELRSLAADKNSCVVEKKVTQSLALQPWCLGNVKESIRNLLDYKIGKYDKELNGILMSYKNFCVLQNIGTIRNDNADINFQVQADYFLFQPYVGAVMTGIVNKKSTTHLGILVHRVFNVVIPRPTEEPGDRWVGAKIQEGQHVKFRIVVLDLFGALPYIRGELDECSVKLETYGDEEVEMKPMQPLNVSYIDFAKTRPQIKVGDRPLDATKNIKSSLHKHSSKPDNDKSHMHASELNTPEKNKTKKQNRQDSESKQCEINHKPSKRHKKGV